MKSKSNIIKYIFVLFAIFIICFAIYKINEKETQNLSNTQNENTVKGDNAEVITNLRLGIAQFDNINPIVTKNRDIINLSTIIYEPLLTLTEDCKTQNVLAEEWSKINDTSYIVKLKSNIKWEDGTKVTSKDVQFTIEKLKEGKSTYSPNVENIKNTEIVDEQTIRINLEKKEAFFEYNLIFPIVSYEQFIGDGDFYESRIAPMSTGMYKVKSATADDMELVKNDNWYNSGVVERKIDTIKLNFYGTMGDAYNSFKIGNIDMICTSNVKISDYIGTIGFTTKDYKGRELDFLSFNCEGDILSRKEVRQAINYAIDKNNIISSVYENEYYISSFPTDYGNYLYTKESTSSYDQNKAKKILEDNGWVYQYGRWRKTENYRTKTIYLDLVVNKNDENRVKVAKLIKKQLEAIGIKIDLLQVSDAYYKKYLEQKNYDIILTGVYNGYSPDVSYFVGENNISNYKNVEVQQLLNDMSNIVDENLLKEKYDRIIEIYEEEVPNICLYRNKGKVVYSMKMTGNFNPNNYTAYYNFANWYRQ